MAPTDSSVSRASNRESVDWYAGLAADSGMSPQQPEHLPSMAEEDEESVAAAPVPQIQVESTGDDAFEDVDKSVQFRVRTLYAYEAQRAEELSKCIESFFEDF